MTQAFLILLSGGILLTTSIVRPRQVAASWLWLGDLIAIALLAAAAGFTFAAGGRGYLLLLMLGSVALHLQCIRVRLMDLARALGAAIFIVLVLVCCPISLSLAVVVTFAGIAATCGLVLMEMLLGHAYLTSSQMTTAPLARLNQVLGLALLGRIIWVAAAILSTLWRSREGWNELWMSQAFLLVVRIMVGLMIPLVFVGMVHDCIRRRATQSATGILYVATVLIFIGELCSLYLVTRANLAL